MGVKHKKAVSLLHPKQSEQNDFSETEQEHNGRLFYSIIRCCFTLTERTAQCLLLRTH